MNESKTYIDIKIGFQHYYIQKIKVQRLNSLFGYLIKSNGLSFIGIYVQHLKMSI